VAKTNKVWFTRFISGMKVGFEIDTDDCWVEVNFVIFSVVYIWDWRQFSMADEDRAKWLNPEE